MARSPSSPSPHWRLAPTDRIEYNPETAGTWEEYGMSKIEKLTFEQAFAELEESVQKLEEGGLTLEEGLALFERGQLLAAHCSQQLDKAELKIKQITPAGEIDADLFEKGA
jgi:exodeoxyribonuclease VII small subunit